jgi:hypothetical protein
MGLSLPPPTQPLTNSQTGVVTEPWYRILAEISRLRSELDALRRLSRNDGAMDSVGVTATVTFVGSI